MVKYSSLTQFKPVDKRFTPELINDLFDIFVSWYGFNRSDAVELTRPNTFDSFVHEYVDPVFEPYHDTIFQIHSFIDSMNSKLSTFNLSKYYKHLNIKPDLWTSCSFFPCMIGLIDTTLDLYFSKSMIFKIDDLIDCGSNGTVFKISVFNTSNELINDNLVLKLDVHTIHNRGKCFIDTSTQPNSNFIKPIYKYNLFSSISVYQNYSNTLFTFNALNTSKDMESLMVKCHYSNISKQYISNLKSHFHGSLYTTTGEIDLTKHIYIPSTYSINDCLKPVSYEDIRTKYFNKYVDFIIHLSQVCHQNECIYNDFKVVQYMLTKEDEFRCVDVCCSKIDDIIDKGYGVMHTSFIAPLIDCFEYFRQNAKVPRDVRTKFFKLFDDISLATDICCLHLSEHVSDYIFNIEKLLKWFRNIQQLFIYLGELIDANKLPKSAVKFCNDFVLEWNTFYILHLKGDKEIPLNQTLELVDLHEIKEIPCFDYDPTAAMLTDTFFLNVLVLRDIPEIVFSLLKSYDPVIINNEFVSQVRGIYYKQNPDMVKLLKPDVLTHYIEISILRTCLCVHPAKRLMNYDVILTTDKLMNAMESTMKSLSMKFSDFRPLPFSLTIQENSIPKSSPVKMTQELITLTLKMMISKFMIINYHDEYNKVLTNKEVADLMIELNRSDDTVREYFENDLSLARKFIVALLRRKYICFIDGIPSIVNTVPTNEQIRNLIKAADGVMNAEQIYAELDKYCIVFKSSFQK